MKELVIGASGLIGSSLYREISKKNREVVGTYFNNTQPNLVPLDITQKSVLRDFLISLAPNIIYLPAANPNVELIETAPELTRKTNVDAVKNVIACAKEINAKLIFYSSDYVFDGENGPYKETDPTNPISEYGKQKLEIERHISGELTNSLIMRITVVYGWEPQEKNFVMRLIKSLSQGQKVKVPNDQIGSPTYAPNLARASRELAISPETGIFHLSGNQLVSRYEFAKKVASIFNLKENLIQPVATSALNQKAKRPLNAGMIVDKAQSLLSSPLIGFEDGLRTMKKESKL